LARSRLLRRASYLDIDIGIKVQGDHLVAFDPNDPMIGHRIRSLGHWERPSFDAVVSLVAARRPIAGATFVDVGANIGTQTVYAMLAGFGHGVAIEPVPRNIRCLAVNLAINGYEDRVTVVQVAAGAARDKLELALDAVNSGGHSLVVPKGPSSARLVVEVVPVDEILARLAIHAAEVGLLWIDVEGFEPEVVEGAKSLLATCPPLVLEFNPDTYGTERARQLLERLGQYYREVAVVNEASLKPRPLVELLEGDLPRGQIDLLFL
jgi:FkbM family methyltransferase